MNAAGLILETFGAGNTPGGPDSAFNNVLSDAVQRGKVIINVTQCLSGTVSPIYAPATILGRAGVVFGQDMTSEAALTKLLYLLSLPDLSSGQIAAMMSRSLCGELTETSKTQFQHPTGILTPEMSRLTLLGYRIQEGDLVGAKEVLQGERGRLLNEADYSGNTPLVSGFRVSTLNSVDMSSRELSLPFHTTALQHFTDYSDTGVAQSIQRSNLQAILFASSVRSPIFIQFYDEYCT